MMNMLYRKIRVNDGFGVSKVVTSTHDKKEDKEHGKLPKNSKMWNCKHDSQTQKQIAEQLGVCRQVVSDRLRKMGKIQKIGRWVTRELNDRHVGKSKHICDILLTLYKRKSFFIV